MSDFNTCLSVDCTEEMKKKVARLAAKHGMNISAFVRLVLEGSIGTVDKKLMEVRKPAAAS